jgi:hypothetical protein
MLDCQQGAMGHERAILRAAQRSGWRGVAELQSEWWAQEQSSLAGFGRVVHGGLQQALAVHMNECAAMGTPKNPL